MHRRTFLRASLVTTAVGAIPLLSGCSGGAESTPATGTPGAPGGTRGAAASTATLRMALDAAPTDNTDPGAVVGGPGAFAVIFNVFDQLVAVVDGKLTPGLALKTTLSADAKKLVLDLDPAARFSDGTPVRPADVLASLAHLAGTATLGAFYADLDRSACRALDEHRVQLAFTRPRADFVAASLTMTSTIAKDGDFTKAIGSGPYAIETATPGQGWRLKPTPHHAGGAPAFAHVDVQVVNDPAARARMLTSGQVDYAANLPAAQAKTLDPSAYRLLQTDPTSELAYGLYLNTTSGPFSDAALRVAAKSTVDRQRLVDVVFSGLGTIGNDLMGKGLPDYASDLPQRTRDVAAAKAAFAKAGVSEIAYAVADVVPGAVDSVELIRQQFQEAGVRLRVDTRDAAGYYADPAALGKLPMLFGYYINRQPAGALPFSQGAKAPFNLSHFADPELDRLLAAATTEVSDTARGRLYAQCQRICWERGGEILWGYKTSTTALRSAFRAGPMTQSIPLLSGFAPA